MKNIVVAITGASGAIYGVRLLEVLLAAGCDVQLLISEAAQTVLRHELNLNIDPEEFDSTVLKLDCGKDLRDPKLQSLRKQAAVTKESNQPGTLRFHHHLDFLAPLASGSYATDGMVVCPCSCGTLGAIAQGVVLNVIHRAAEVHLKERRKLILVPRETPLSLIHLQNMERACLAGAVILPAMPAFYHGVQQVGDLVDSVVSRICSQLGVANTLVPEWGN